MRLFPSVQQAQRISLPGFFVMVASIAATYPDGPKES